MMYYESMGDLKMLGPFSRKIENSFVPQISLFNLTFAKARNK